MMQPIVLYSNSRFFLFLRCVSEFRLPEKGKCDTLARLLETVFICTERDWHERNC